MKKFGKGQRGIWGLAAAWTIVLTSVACDAIKSDVDLLHPRQEPQMSRVGLLRADIAPERDAASQAYFAAPIPRTLHLRAGLAGLDNESMAAWAAYAVQHGYTARSYELADDEAIDALLPAPLAPLAARLREAGREDARADLVGYAALAAEGGVLVSRQARPPTLQGETVPWQAVAPMAGMVLVPQARARNIGKEESVFVGLDVVMAAPEHPNLTHLLAALPGHLTAALKDEKGLLETDYLTGAAAFNRALGGLFTLLPRRSLLDLEAISADAAGGDLLIHGSLGVPQAAAACRPPTEHGAWLDPAACFSTAQPPRPQLPPGGMQAVADETDAWVWGPEVWRQVPSLVHQIWFGDPTKRPEAKCARWQAWSENFGYRYRLWTEADLAEICSFMPAENVVVMQRALEARQYQCAADVLRVSILANVGGIYVDTDYTPPRGATGADVDLRHVAPMRGLTLLSEPHSREVGADSFFSGNSLLISAPHHPIMRAAQKQIHGHFVAMLAGLKSIDPWRATGPLFLTRLLGGPVVILPLNWAFQYGMYEEEGWAPVAETRVAPPMP